MVSKNIKSEDKTTITEGWMLKQESPKAHFGKYGHLKKSILIVVNITGPEGWTYGQLSCKWQFGQFLHLFLYEHVSTIYVIQYTIFIDPFVVSEANVKGWFFSSIFWRFRICFSCCLVSWNWFIISFCLHYQ